MIESPFTDTVFMGGDSTMDCGFQIALGLANGVVTLMNATAYVASGDARDMAAAFAWMGSTLYWFWRARVG